jgi:DNA-binding XRE family transcriptional regulator
MRRKEDSKDAAGESTRPLYNRLAVLRADRQLSRQQLAEEVGVNYQTIGYIERGEYNPSLELAFRLSEVFGLPIEAMFSRRQLRPLSEELYNRSRGKEESGT